MKLVCSLTYKLTAYKVLEHGSKLSHSKGTIKERHS